MALSNITQQIHHSQTLALKGIIAEQEREISRLRRMILGKTSESQIREPQERDYGTGGDEFINPATGIDDWRD
jgi:hypothetical protein